MSWMNRLTDAVSYLIIQFYTYTAEKYKYGDMEEFSNVTSGFL